MELQRNYTQLKVFLLHKILRIKLHHFMQIIENENKKNSEKEPNKWPKKGNKNYKH